MNESYAKKNRVGREEEGILRTGSRACKVIDMREIEFSITETE